jgi:hypothetical protein
VTLGGDGVLVVVDLSNLCRDRRILPAGSKADLGVLDRLIDALEESELPVSRVKHIADRSLVPLVDSMARRRLREMERDGIVEFSSLADERLLELAFGGDYAEPGTLVASMDNFDDFRRSYPAIQGSTDRFLGWQPEGDGGLRVELRDMGVHSHQRLSRKEESAEFKARRLHRESVVRRAAATHFQCQNTDCLVAQLWPDRIPELPRYDDRTDQFVCPSCEAPLTVGEPRPRGIQLIVFLHGAEQFRLLLEEEGRVVVGRKDANGCVGLESRLPPGTADAVSRSHVSFALVNGRVHVEDLDSRNGTVVRLVDTGTDHRLVAGMQHVMGRREEIALPSGITIELSGRTMAFDGARPANDAESDDDSELRSTRILVTRR